MPNLPKHGITLAVENAQKSLLDLDKFNARVEQSGKIVQRAAANVSPLNKALGNLEKQVQSSGQRILESVPGGQALTGVLSAIPGPALAAAAGVAAAGAAAVAAAAGFIALGSRGAPLVGMAESFDRLTASVGLSSKALLEDLRKASGSTISDFGLIERANLALVGSTGEFGQAFGKALPKLLEAARASARATGQSVDFLYQSIVTGIKRGSPLILDNLGLVISVGDANKTYAESIGKTVEQLTEQEQKIALLNATLAAGEQLITAVGGAQETAADKIARATASISNILDVVSIAVQPAFGAIMDVVNDVLGGIENFVRKAAPYISIVAQVIAQGVKFIGGIIKDLGKRMLQGGFNTLKAFGEGAAFAVNKIIFPVIIRLATLIADFLSGNSPPPKGPLKDFDKGGFNVMSAWLDGFSSVSLDPVEQVAAEVSAALGNIGKANLPQVDARLAELDKALIPFQNRLDIVKSRFDAIAEPAKAALDAIDRQQVEAEAALASGDQAAAERIRLLDAQRAAIQENLDAQQSIVDRSQVQLALAQAQQAQERALLNIRKTQLQVSQKVAAAVDKATGKAPKEEKAKKGGEAAEPVTAGGVGANFELPDSSVLDDLTLSAEDARNAFDSLFGADAIPDFTANQAALDAQLNRIKSIDPATGLASRFKGLTDIFDPSNPDSVAGKISGFLSTLTGDKEGSIAYFFSNDLPARFESIKTTVSTALQSALDSVFNPDTVGSPLNRIREGVAEFTGLFTTEGSLANLFSQLSSRFEGIQAGLQTALLTTLDSVFNPETEGSPANVIMGIIEGITGEEEGSIAYFFSLLPQRISDAASGLLEKIQTDIFNPVSDFLTGSDPGTFGGIINNVVAFFTDLPARITAALQGLAVTLNAALVVPVVNVFNSMIGAVETGLRNLLNNALNLASSAIGALGPFAPPELATAIATLKSSVSNLTIPRIAVPAIEEAATGGMFTKGLIKVGERGPEYIGAASRIGILPTEITRALDGLGSILAAPAPVMVPAGNNYNSSNDNHAMTNNFYGQTDPAGVMRRMSVLKARSR